MPPSEDCSLACEGDTPVCDAESATCKTCTAEAGCADPLPFCDPEANDGLGVCVECMQHAECPAERPVCDRMRARACTAPASTTAPFFRCATERRPKTSRVHAPPAGWA